ncbi:MAG: TonB-dependent receptor plug domain-containing protein [Flavipsychrobacter sp.]
MNTNNSIKKLFTTGPVLLALCCFVNKLQAQQVSDTLKAVQVHGARKLRRSNDERLNVFSPGQKVTSIDSVTMQQYQNQNLANLLSQQTPIFIKSYGFNSLSTLNFRGASAAQSIVLWDGVPIQDASLGIADVSQLPVLLMNKVNLVYGSSAALWGSGNVGGALLLETEQPFFDSNGKSSLSVAGGAGSFQQYTGGLKSSFSSKRFFFSLDVFGQTAKDNFRYKTAADTTAQMPNARLKGGSVMGQAAYLLGNQNVLRLSVWYQDYYREVPPALFEAASVKNYANNSLRLLLDWNKQTTRNTWYAKASLISNQMHYNDSLSLLNTSNTTYQYYFEAGWKYKLGNNSQLLIFVPLQAAKIVTVDTAESQQQTKSAIAAAYDVKLFHDRLDIAINGRAEVINTVGVLLPGANASYRLTNWLSIRANVQKTYRAPTLNELYYDPGGNPNLKPEQGWNEDAGYTLKLKPASQLSFYHDLSVFNRVIDNWIVWFGGAIWTPHNIATVHSRGVETENRLQWQLNNNWSLHLGLNTSYIIATTQSSYITNDNSIGKQIPYTPRYNGQLNAGFGYKHLYLNYNHTYTGYRFLTTDESEYILPYNAGNVQLMYDLTIGHYPLSLSVQCNNIWDQQYQVVAYRPMPGINWLAGVKLTLL